MSYSITATDDSLATEHTGPMTLERTALSPSHLSSAAQRALAPGPTRLMAARGLAPLPQPRDMVSVLYQLVHDREGNVAGKDVGKVAEAAGATAKSLPDAVLAGALSDGALDPRVLDYFAELCARRIDMLQRIIANPATAGETIVGLAGRLGADDVDLIAQNEQRLLSHPEIVGAMFHNRRARMSTVDRAVELAARNQVKVPNIPGWEGIARAALSAGAGIPADPGADSAFARALGGNDAADAGSGAAPADAGETGERRSRGPNIAAMTIPQKIRAATLGNKFLRSTLIRDANKLVASAAIKAPGVTDIEAAKYAGNHSLSDDVIKYIAGRREWTKNYGTKLSLVLNPKTPIADAMRFLPHLRERDMRSVARSKGIASAVATQAKKFLTTRGAKKK